MNRFKKFIHIISLVLVAIAFYFFGYLVGHKNLVFEQNYQPKLINKELMKPKTIDFAVFWDAWQKVQEKFAGETDTQKMVYGAISGMVDSLDDPYSMFMEPELNKTFAEDLSGEIQGIGAEISIREGKITIIAPLDDSPAAKAGLKPMDIVLKIGEDSTDGLTLNEAIEKIRGKAGSRVKLQIIREGWVEPQIFEIVRSVIKIESVKWKMDGDLAYINITQFGSDTYPLLEKAANEIKNKNPKGIILDLRNNPGGYLDASVDVASVFMTDKVVVKEKYKDGHIDELKTDKPAVLANINLIVLINKGSASASEIVAGALRDANRAKIFGETSFGKGSVQTLEELDKGAALRVTIAKWLTPNGNAIDKVGIEPDEKITLSEEDEKADRDPQLDRAKEILNKG